MRRTYAFLGFLSLVLGAIGAVLPLLPTVPFIILAAYFFARGNPAWERRLLEHPHFGPHIIAWRERGAVSRKGKIVALITLAGSATFGLLALSPPYSAIPAVVAVISGTWIVTRPTA